MYLVLHLNMHFRTNGTIGKRDESKELLLIPRQPRGQNWRNDCETKTFEQYLTQLKATVTMALVES